jgi:SAM-dependent methyltransferase
MTVPDTADGAAVYGPIFVRFFYDIFVIAFSLTYVWRCPAKKLTAFFARNIGSVATEPGTERTEPFRLMDIGVGTGYQLQHAPIPKSADAVLVDLRDISLEAASKRLQKAHPTVSVRTTIGDFLEFDNDSFKAIVPERFPTQFDAISCMLLLHCVPGPPSRKAEGLRRLAPLLSQDGVLFGATILGKGVKHNWIARAFLSFYNRRGDFSNAEDDVEGLLRPLRKTFRDVRAEIVGDVLLFELRGPDC